MKRFFQMLLIVLLIVGACGCGKSADSGKSGQATPDIAMEAKMMVDFHRPQLPVSLGNQPLLLTEMAFDEGSNTLVYDYQYTVPDSMLRNDKPIEERFSEAKAMLIGMLKANPGSDEVRFLKNGISFHYRYYTQGGALFYELDITPDDIKD